MSATIEGRALSVERGGRRILNDVSATFLPGRLTAVIGPNGSGKTTLLRVLGGLWQASTGVVHVNGQPVHTRARREVAKMMAFLPQDTRCDFAFTVEEVVAMGRHPHRGRFEPERERDRRAIEAAMATCDLEALRLRTVDHLSGGERQRVAIARCLATDPDAILLDEPTAHLDLEHALAIVALSRQLADEGRTILLATHDLGLVARHATDVLLLKNGRVAGFGTPAQVLTPEVCRDVFAVEAEILATADGGQAFVFHPVRPSATNSSDRR